MMEKEFILSALREGRLRLKGQFIYGSNYTFMGVCEYQGQSFSVVYKPMQGERPLWDFPKQTLAKREVAAFLVSEALGWALVPPTVFRIKNTPMGPGSAQYYIEHDPAYHYFSFNDSDRKGFRRVMLFDLLINNADRKAGHLLMDPQGVLWLIDHGLSFHVEDKLRTVIWDYAGETIPPEQLSDVDDLITKLFPGNPLYQALLPLLSTEEIQALVWRAENLLQAGIFPLPPEDRRAYPWPLV